MESGMNEERTSVNGMQKNYTRLRKKEKSRMLDHLVEDHEYNRQYALRLLSRRSADVGRKERRGSKPRYKEAYTALKQVW